MVHWPVCFWRLNIILWLRLIHLLSVHLRHPSVGSWGPSTTSWGSPWSILPRASLEILLISIPLIARVVPRSTELRLCVTTVWSVREWRAVTIISSSESIGRAPVSVHQASSTTRASTRHTTTVVIGLTAPRKPRVLLGRLLVVTSHLMGLVLGTMVSANHCLKLFLLKLCLLYLVRLTGKALVIAGLVLILLF